MSTQKWTLTAAVDQNRKKQFIAAAHARSLSTSCQLVLLIDEFLGIEPVREPDSPAPGGAKTKDVAVRLTPYHYAELHRLARARNWHRSTYLAHLFDVHLTGNPRFCEDEVATLRQLARQLADIGRNINQIAKSLHCSLDNAHMAMALDFDALKMLIEVETVMVKELVRANVQFWRGEA